MRTRARTKERGLWACGQGPQMHLLAWRPISVPLALMLLWLLGSLGLPAVVQLPVQTLFFGAEDWCVVLS